MKQNQFYLFYVNHHTKHKENIMLNENHKIETTEKLIKEHEKLNRLIDNAEHNITALCDESLKEAKLKRLKLKRKIEN